MTWYYAEGSQQKGPVSDTEIDQLFTAGQITGSTLIWREGMAAWEPYSSVRGGTASAAPAGGGAVICCQCGQLFPNDDVIRYGDKAVCAKCKPVFLQKLREGATISSSDMEYAGFWIRFLAKFVDGIILQVVNGIAGFVVGAIMGAAGQASGEPNLAFIGVIYAMSFAIHIAYNTFFVGFYGATPGKMACKIRIVTADGGKVSYPRAFGRSLAEFLSSFTCLIGYIMAAFDEEKRSLHDRICDTRVIRNS